VPAAGAAGDREHRNLGRHRFQHGGAVHLAALGPPRALRGGHARRLLRAADGGADQGPDDPALADHDLRVLDHRDAAGVRRADAAAAPDQLDLHDLLAADEDLPRRFHRERHLHSLRGLRAGGPRNLRHLLRLPAPGAQPGLRPGRAVSTAMTTSTTRAPATTPGPTPSSRNGSRGGGAERPSIVATGVLVLGALYSLIPIVWVLFAASKRSDELLSTFSFAPSAYLLHDRQELFADRDGLFLRWAGSTALYAVGGALLSTLVSAAAGYGLALFVFRGKKLFFNIILAGVLLPAVILAVPQYLLFAEAGLANTYWAVLLPSILNPYGIYLARIYAGASVPREMIEAARTDGAGELR